MKGFHVYDAQHVKQIVRTGIIGAGWYATGIITQSPYVPALNVPVAADVDIEAARLAFRRAGIADEDIVSCDTWATVLQAIETGKRAIVSDGMLLMDLPLDVIVEATGVPEAGARHAQAAIAHGKHVVMVNKEADATVGPILKVLAERAGVVYTAADGDQPGLLIGLVQWARTLGLEVHCGGKFRNGELIFDPHKNTLSDGKQSYPLTATVAKAFAPHKPEKSLQDIGAIVQARRAAAADLYHAGSYDIGEMVIAANGTGLLPDIETLHTPILYPCEIPQALCAAREGGILMRGGAIEVVTCLHHPYEAGMGGGVFIVVGCANDFSREVLTTKGLLTNARKTAALIYRPHHLCGVETATSILNAGLRGHPTGAIEYFPHVDVVAQAARPLKAGECIQEDAALVEALMQPAVSATQPDRPLPLYMAVDHPLAKDVAQGTILTAAMIEAPEDSVLWSLRTQQEEHFKGSS